MAGWTARGGDCDMDTDRAGIALGCTTCGLELFLPQQDDSEVRLALVAFFEEHSGCDVFMDVSRAGIPLPRRAGDELSRRPNG